MQFCIVYHSQTSSSKEELEKSFILFSLTQSVMDTSPATLLVRKTFQTHIMDQETGLRRIGHPQPSTQRRQAPYGRWERAPSRQPSGGSLSGWGYRTVSQRLITQSPLVGGSVLPAVNPAAAACQYGVTVLSMIG